MARKEEERVKEVEAEGRLNANVACRYCPGIDVTLGGDGGFRQEVMAAGVAEWAGDRSTRGGRRDVALPKSASAGRGR